MVDEFSLEVTDVNEIPVIRVKGEIDIYTCPQLKDALVTVLDKGKNDLILDLEQIHYIDSTGLGTIAFSAKDLDERKGKLNVVCSKPQVKKIFEISGLSSKNIQLFDQEESAIDDLL
jgi:anti-sigma B factor antagonist